MIDANEGGPPKYKVYSHPHFEISTDSDKECMYSVHYCIDRWGICEVELDNGWYYLIKKPKNPEPVPILNREQGVMLSQVCRNWERFDGATDIKSSRNTAESLIELGLVEHFGTGWDYVKPTEKGMKANVG